MRIELENLSKRFDDGSDVLKNLHFADEVHTLAIIGSSGSGKSTLLRLLGGLLTPSSGMIKMIGERSAKRKRAGQLSAKNRFRFSAGRIISPS